MGVIHDYGMPFTDQAGDRKYNSAQWREYFGKLIKDGVIQNAGNQAAVKQQAVANKSVFVDTGTVFIQGVMRIASSTTTLNCADNTSGNPRIDRVVARLNYTTRRIEFAILQGTPAASPVAPALTRNTSVYELALADITLANGFSTILTANINDKRWDVNLCGAASMTIGVIPPSGLDAVTVQLEPETQALYGVGNVDDALKRAIVDLSSFQAFCANANVNSLDAAFGKNNEDLIFGLGLQLAMYAWFKGDSKITYHFTHLKTKHTLDEILNDPYSFGELLMNNNIVTLINASTGFAKNKLTPAYDTDTAYKALLANMGYDPNLYTQSQFVNNASLMNELCLNATQFTLACQFNSLMGAMWGSHTARQAMYDAHATTVSILTASTKAMTQASVYKTRYTDTDTQATKPWVTLQSVPCFVLLTGRTSGGNVQTYTVRYYVDGVAERAIGDGGTGHRGFVSSLQYKGGSYVTGYCDYVVI